MGAATPGLARIDAPTPLTKREAEIARLAARGLPSKDIAAQLFVSVRTVDSHVKALRDGCRQNRGATVVERGMQCYSACAFAFLGGSAWSSAGRCGAMPATGSASPPSGIRTA